VRKNICVVGDLDQCIYTWRQARIENLLEFEKEWSKYIGTKYSLFCNSGSSANLLMIYAAMTANKLRNNKIVVPSVGWGTTISPAIQFGLEPIMVGANPFNFGIDLDELEEVCKKHNPAIVMFVQVLGVPHRKERLLNLKEKYGFILLEDACAALGSEYADGSKVGTVGDMSSFSLYFGHQASTIEGGLVNTNSKKYFDTLVMLRSHGWLKDLDENKYKVLIEDYEIDDFHKPFTFFVPGFNLRSTDLQAFIGLRQVKKLPLFAQKRNDNHLRYAFNFKNKLRFQYWDKDKPVSISFGLLANSKEQRKKIVTELVNNGIETRIFSAGNLGRHPFWVEKYGIFRHEISDSIHDTGFFLPNYPELSLKEVDYISDVVKSVL